MVGVKVHGVEAVWGGRAWAAQHCQMRWAATAVEAAALATASEAWYEIEQARL